MEKHAHTNRLISESSPYLLQHAHNPVDWYPWGEVALEKARSEDKLIIVSIGYSSCHWCHVMEHESFEDPAVAQMMNDHFVCIKIDREERPDIDHVFMTAVQLLNQQGGWPLNCIALPDGRPIWGGTYFPKNSWIEALGQVHNYYMNNREASEQYAARLAEGIAQSSLFQAAEFQAAGFRATEKGNGLTEKELKSSVQRWAQQFDLQNGGMKGAPKFPMPVNLEFLLHYGFVNKDQEILDFVETTLNLMARGGIYDQAGGGFARYSVDTVWKVPHFEKMLYDNAQLIGLYAQAYQVFGIENYLSIIDQSVEFLQREMLNAEGSFYSALDADSEGEEGKFYVWKREKLEALFPGDFALLSEYYNINETGHWEDGNYILYRTADPDEFAAERGLNPEEFRQKVEGWNRTMLEARNERTRPGLDDKSLTSWNSLAISGLVKAYRATGKQKYLEMARRCARMIRDKLWSSEKILYRNYKDGKVSIPGFHIDYALSIMAFLDLYESTMDEAWIGLGQELTGISMEKFLDPGSGLFRFNTKDSKVLITHQLEIQDNVIPSSNSVMALALFKLGHLLINHEYLDIASGMVQKMRDRIEKYPMGFAGWGKLLLALQHPFYEIVVVGPEAASALVRIQSDYLPHAVVSATTKASDLPLFRNRDVKDKTHIFVCRDNVCQLPVEKPEDAKAIYHYR